jgi:hypothetical protein
MATTIKIQDTVNWAAAFSLQRPTTGVGGTANEPALTSANLIMQTIVAPPFRWSWNRTFQAGAFTTTTGVSDYQVAISNYGYIEKAVANYVVVPANTKPSYELEVYNNIGKEGILGRPAKIAVLLDDNAGNMTFRLFPVPDVAYTIDLLYQKAPPLASVLGNTTWAPVPDKYAFVYERGFLAQLQMMYNQQLALSNMEIFFRQLISVSEGLTENEKNIFLADMLRSAKMQAAEISGTQQGKSARQ